jgi:3-isopropylmalate/(R)-2-methylmalate dehydratase small subunit
MSRGRVWKFGDHVNTDLIMPGWAYDQSEEVQTRATFSAVRPGFCDLFSRDDVIVGGLNFGTGSSRPAARSLRNLGCACLIAESINGIFLRNCVSFGLLALEAPGISAAVEEGQHVAVDIDRWTATVMETGFSLALRPVVPELLTLMRNGGIFPVLERAGYIGGLAEQSGQADD